ncbi:MAG: Ig-like domain-containing protein, partial [Candidatus Limnocylindria bacterium]
MDENEPGQTNPSGMPDRDRRELPREELAPERARGAWLRDVREWFSRSMATRRGRAVLAGSALVGVAAATLATVFVLGFFSTTSKQAPVAESSTRASASASAKVGVDLPIEAAFQMTATKADAIGVDLDTEFVLTSAEDLPIETVQGLLHVEPAVELSVARESAGNYRIGAVQPLEPGTVYRFLMADAADATPHVLASFAFQTKTPVGVVQTTPRNASTSVPINTGIELTFTQEGVQDIEGHFAIEPNVPGRFEAHGRVSVFVPQEELAAGTLYTVTVTRGLSVEGSSEVMADDFVLQFETGESGRTGEIARQPVLNFTRKMAEAATGEAPVLETFTTSQSGAVTLSVQVYGFDGMQGFLDTFEAYEELPRWAGIAREAFVTETDGLEEVATFDVDLQRFFDYGKSFIQFPAPLPAGFYLVRTEFNGQPIQAWLQVTDVATYVALAEDRTLVWVNDVDTQGPLAGARVEFIGADVSGETGLDGTLTLDTLAQSVQTVSNEYGYSGTEVRGNLLVSAADGRAAVVPLSSIEGYYSGYYTPYGFGSDAGDAYWNYLSTDRPLYLPTDTVHFWGIARPRENPGSQTLTIQLTSYSYVGYDYRPVVVAETVVETSGIGTFTGDLLLAGLSPDSYDLRVTVNGEVISRANIHVQRYTKPAYQIGVTPDKLAAFVGDSITFSIDATFLEGSPVPGLALNYSSGSGDGQVTTDENGHASVTVTGGEGNPPSYYPTQTYMYVTPVRAEEGEIVGEGMVSTYPASVTASARTEVDGGQGVVTGTVHHVDLTRINEGTSPGSEDLLGSPAAGVAISFDITDVSYIQTETGEYYDFIEKIVRKQYRYDQVEVALGTFTALTDANGTFRYAFPVDPARYYRIDMRVTDAQGRAETWPLAVSGSQSQFGYGNSYVHLRPADGDYGSSTASFFGGAERFSLGAPVSLAMFRGSDELPSGGVNRYL